MGKKRGRPKSAAKTIVVYGRFDVAVIEALDAIRASMSIKVSRNQLIGAAIKEYVDRHGEQESKRN